MSIHVNDTPHQQPDVSKATPVHVPSSGTRSYPVDVIYIGEYGRYRRVAGYWDDLDKCWRTESGGQRIAGEIVRTEPNEDTIQHY